MTADARAPRPATTLTRLAWDVALDRVELDVIQVERMLTSRRPMRLEPWDQPTVDGPIPAEMLPRALALQERQAAAMEAIAAAMTTTGRQQAFADRVNPRSVNGLLAPAYVDLTA